MPRAVLHTNLFFLNRCNGVDRLEGGLRVDVGLQRGKLRDVPGHITAAEQTGQRLRDRDPAGEAGGAQLRHIPGREQQMDTPSSANHSNLAKMRAYLRTQTVEPGVMQTILGRAIDCGGIATGRLTPRIMSLPTSLARHEILMTFEFLSGEVIEEIVDGVFCGW